MKRLTKAERHRGHFPHNDAVATEVDPTFVSITIVNHHMGCSDICRHLIFVPTRLQARREQIVRFASMTFSITGPVFTTFGEYCGDESGRCLHV